MKDGCDPTIHQNNSSNDSSNDTSGLRLGIGTEVAEKSLEPEFNLRSALLSKKFARGGNLISARYIGPLRSSLLHRVCLR